VGLQHSIDELRHELVRLRRREHIEESLRSELRGLRETLDRRRATDPAQAVDEAAESLARSGLEWRHALSIATDWRARREEEAGLTLERVLRGRIEECLAVPRVDGAEAPRILVGAAGVGKTTTLAKLAARNEEGERDVAFVSLDGYRVGAQAQLRGYAELLESPHVEAASAAELPGILSRFPRHSVLIDTAGRARAAENRLEPLLDLRRALGKRASIELVVDASTRREVQDAQIERFAVLEPERLIFSRVDECGSVVEMANLLLDGRCPPVCWMTTGQRVPEDLALVEPTIFSRPILGEAA
jgi:flagellar biosynthesis protein FlhF